jgi:hypothetical protein
MTDQAHRKLVSAKIVASVATTLMTATFSQLFINPPWVSNNVPLLFSLASAVGGILGIRGKIDKVSLIACGLTGVIIGSIYILLITLVGRTIPPYPVEYLFFFPIGIAQVTSVCAMSGVVVAAVTNGLKKLVSKQASF